MARLEAVENARKEVVIEKTQFMLRKHYGENEVETIIAVSYTHLISMALVAAPPARFWLLPRSILIPE